MNRLFLALCIVVSGVATMPAAFAQNALDATMRPLDELAAVEGVIAAIERAAGRAARRSEGHAAQDAGDTDRQPSDTGPRGRQKRNTDDVVARIDRDQRSDKEVEDFDVPEDVDIPPPLNEGL
jgi:hypothetical protein